MKVASLPSGEATLLGGVSGRSPLAHWAPLTSQVQRLPSASNEKRWRSVSNVIDANGRRVPLIGFPMAAVRAVATAAWSNAGAFTALTGSTRMYSVPVAVWLRYQNWSSGSQFARTAPFDTSGVVL